MKKLLIFVFMMAIVAGVANAATATDNKSVLGEWKYEVPEAPYGYEKGVIVITENEGKLEGKIKFDDGYKIDLKKVSLEEGTLKLALYVDYEYVSVTTKVDGKKMTGTVTSSEGNMKLTAEKVK